MRVAGQEVFDAAIRRHPAIRKWLLNWLNEVAEADWNNIQDVRKWYPMADGVKLSSNVIVTVFNVKGNSYRLLTSIDYSAQTVVVLEVLTHAEYSKDSWKRRY